MKEKNKLKWKYLVFPFILLLLFVWTNYYIDPASIFHNDSEQWENMARSIVNGDEVYFAFNNGNEREVKHHLIMQMPDQVDCVVIGPSLAMCIDREMTGDSIFYNLGESGADLYDILAQFGLMEKYSKKTERIIFCVDTYFFDRNIYLNREIHLPLISYAEYMLSRLGAEPDVEIVHDDSSDKNDLDYVKLKQLFSITYFQESVNWIRKSQTLFLPEKRIGIVDQDFDYYNYAYYRYDGSCVYSESFANRGTDLVLNEMKEYDVFNKFPKNCHLNEYNKMIFEKVVQYCIDSNIEIDLFLCPLSPLLWDRLQSADDNYFILDELESFANEIAEKYDLKITGSYNPYNLNVCNEDFYDERHIKRDKLANYFDFKAKNQKF